MASTQRAVLSPFTTGARYKTLLVASTLDPASMNLASALQKRDFFQQVNEELWHGKSSLMWVQNESLLRLDHVDKLFKDKFNMEQRVDEVIFLSKHFAASGTTSLTVHPIGIPWQTENSRSGGVPGRCSPPNRRIARLYRSILNETKKRGLDSRYQITQEATHHGPFVEIPTCFVEIGSTESDWGIPEAGEMWADVLVDELSNERQEGDSIDSDLKELVVMCIGGGHYVPRLNDVARLGENIYSGHALSTYTIESLYNSEEASKLPNGWKGVINEAVDSTRISYPHTQLFCILDKKAFKPPFKAEIIEYLNSLGIQWSHSSSDVKTLYNKLNSIQSGSIESTKDE